MSPRAACRLATLGFERVYDYMPGKVDWMARGLPMEGAQADEPRAIDVARHDVVTCRLDEPVSAVRQRVETSPYAFALVTTADGVLLGRLRRNALDDSDHLAAQAMEPGPSTSRPDTAPGELLARLRRRELTTALLTDPEGRLLGLVTLGDLEAMRSQPQHG